MGLGDKSLILSPFSTIIKGVRENIRVAYIFRNGDKTALFVPEAHGCWLFRAYPFVPPGDNPRHPSFPRTSQSAAGARCHAASGHLSPVVYGRGTKWGCGDKSEGTKWEGGDKSEGTKWECGDKSEGTNQRGQIRGDKMGVRGQNETIGTYTYVLNDSQARCHAASRRLSPVM